MSTFNDITHAFANGENVDYIMQLVSECEPLTYNNQLLIQTDCALYDNIFECWFNIFDSQGLFSTSLPLMNLDISNNSLSFFPDRSKEPLCVILNELRNNNNRNVDFEQFRYFNTPTVKNENTLHFCCDSIFGFIREEFASEIIFRLILTRNNDGKYTLTYLDTNNVSLPIFVEV